MKKQMTKTYHKGFGYILAGCAALLLVCMPMKSLAAATGTVIPATAKIRSEASTSSEAVGSTSAGKTVNILEETTGSDGNVWYKIEVDGSTTGYIRSDLVNKSGSVESSSATSSSTTSSTSSGSSSVTTVDSQAATVSTDSANVRSTASTTGSVVASVKKGAAVTITGQATGDDGKDWYQVTFTNNGSSATGFIRSDLVSAGSAATTEVSGTKTNDSNESDTSEGTATDEGTTEEGSTEEGTTEEGTEAAPEEQSAEEEQQSSNSTGDVTVMNTEETPQLPAGFQEVAVTLNGEEVRAWKNGDFYIFYGMGQDGTEGYYMYDAVQTVYQRYFMTNTETTDANGSDGASGILKPVVIVMAVILVILLVIITILTIKMNDYRAELEWDDDEDDDYYPEDEDDDVDFEEEEEVRRPQHKKVKRERPVRVIEEDEEEDEEPVRPMPKKKPVPAKQTVPVKKTQPARQSQETRQPKAQPGRAPQSGKVQSAKPSAAKPRNFMETDEEEIVRPVKKVKKPAVRSVVDDVDPDDEDSFVFINLDGDDLD